MDHNELDYYENDVSLDVSHRMQSKWEGIANQADEILSDCFVSMDLTDGELQLLERAHKNVCSVRRVLTAIEIRHRRLKNDRIHD